MTFSNVSTRIVVVGARPPSRRVQVIILANRRAEVETDDRGPLSQQIVNQRDGQQLRRPRGGDAIFIRNRVFVAETAAAPAVRSHVISPYKLKRPPTQIVDLRAPDLPVVFTAPAVRSHVVTPYKLRLPPTRVVFQRNPIAPDPVATGESLIAVIHARARTRNLVARDVDVIFLRNPATSSEPPAVRIHVVTPYKLRQPKTSVVSQRNPGRHAIGKSGILVVHGRFKTRHPARDVKVIFQRGAFDPGLFNAPAVRSHVVSPYRLRLPTVRVTVLRGQTERVIFPSPVEATYSIPAPSIVLGDVEILPTPVVGVYVVVSAPTVDGGEAGGAGKRELISTVHFVHDSTVTERGAS